MNGSDDPIQSFSSRFTESESQYVFFTDGSKRVGLPFSGFA